jgi:thiamine-phosphate pyrophosphorylase
VTDRRQLAARVGCDPDSTKAIDALVHQARAAATAGVVLVHLRESDLSASRLADAARAIRAALTSLGARLVVNDRVDVALASKADGVHLKSSSIEVLDARRLLGTARLVGRSVHAVAEMRHAEHADYVVFGAVFPSRSKPEGWTPAGPTALAESVRTARHQPVLAIGGITVETAAAAARCGAAGIAAIGAFLPAEGAPLDESVQQRVSALRLAFDSASRVS